ncbi:MAG: segregation/condensation protein A [Candidatus Omnitrophica bacterium]|nr:segregation/condensation protein A [Candidatus Omnitrophota bacterium]
MAYKVKLEIFEGPLDLLLYLVKQNHLEITQIPIAQVTDQYLKYLELMQALDLDIAGEFLVMAATLMQIKSRSLLPPDQLTPAELEEPDPAQELIQRLMEYSRFKEAAQWLSGMEQGRQIQFTRPSAGSAAGAPALEEEYVEASLFDLLTAFSQFMGSLTPEMVHEVIRDEFTVEGRIAALKELIQEKERVSLQELFSKAAGKLEVVATFLALLELIRQKAALVRQSQLFGEIWVIRNTGSVEVAG